MHDFFDKIIEFFSGIARFRWTALATAWILALIGWIMVAQIDARYPATARVFVDTNKILEPLLQGIAVQPDVKQRVALMSKTLLSRPNIERMIAEHHLDARITTVAGREKLIEHLQHEISIEDTNGSKSLYALSYSHKDPNIAMNVVESTIDIFVNSSMQEEKADNETTIRFLDKQINEYELRLRDAEERLAGFKRTHAGSLPGESGGFYQRMETLVGQQRKSELEYAEARNRRDSLRRQLANEERKIMLNSQNGPVDARIKEQQAKLDELLVRFTENHPHVSILKESIADLQTHKTSSRNRTNKAALLQKSVVYQKVSTLLAEAEAKVAQLRVRNRNYTDRVNGLKGTVDSMPQVEAELKQLDRDYETVRRQHETLLKKRESARITSSIEEDANDVKMRLIDPPFVPSRPTDPDKLLLNAVVLVGAVGAGLALAFFLSLLRPVFYNPRSLETYTDIPVLGGISFQPTPMIKLKSRVNSLNFGMLSVMLPVTLACLLFVQLKNASLYDRLKFNLNGNSSADSTIVSVVDSR